MNGSMKTPDNKAEFQRQKRELEPKIGELLGAYRLFVAPLPSTTPDEALRLRQRIEDAILRTLRARPGIESRFLDDGISRPRGRRPSEEPFVVTMRYPVAFCGLPERLEA